MSPTPPPFQAFLDEHHQPVLAFLRGMVGPHDAEDCLQETFLAALRAYPRADGRNLRGWVLTIARRKAIDHERARARRADPVPDPEELAGAGADGRIPGMSPRDGEVWTAVGALPRGQRAAVLLRFAVDLRYREIGRALGCSEQAARQRVSEGLGKLRVEAGIGGKEPSR
jgi:RNA polymerase sigma factor (sigma-70 family)